MFEEEFRTVRTRDIIYSPDQMRIMRLRAVYNAAGDIDYMNREVMESIFKDSIRSGESGLIEIKYKGKRLVLLSILVFEDFWSRNIYALSHWEIYKSFSELLSLQN